MRKTSAIVVVLIFLLVFAAVPAAAQEVVPAAGSPASLVGIQPIVGRLAGTSARAQACVEVSPLTPSARRTARQALPAGSHRVWLPTVTSWVGPMCEVLPATHSLLGVDYQHSSLIVKGEQLYLAGVGSLTALIPPEMTSIHFDFADASQSFASLELKGYIPFSEEDYAAGLAAGEPRVDTQEGPAPPLPVIRDLERVEQLRKLTEVEGNIWMPSTLKFHNGPSYFGSQFIIPQQRGLYDGVWGQPINATAEKSSLGWNVWVQMELVEPAHIMAPYLWVRFVELWDNPQILDEETRQDIDQKAEDSVVRYQTDLSVWLPDGSVTGAQGMVEVFAISTGVVIAVWALTPSGGGFGGGGLYYFQH